LIHLKSIPYIFLVLVLTAFTVNRSTAQETIFEGTTVTYSSEQSGGVGMHTNGFHGFYRFGNYKGAFKKQMFEIELANIRHPQEVKSVNPMEDDLRGYIYGKKNALYTLRPSIGIHNVFIPKQSLRGVSITYILQVGPSLGLAKPVYLNVEKLDQQGNRVIVRERYDPNKHDQGVIYGRASFLNGFGELKLYPGLFVKAGLQFEYGGTQEDIRAIEVGLTADLYAEKIPMMAFTSNRQLFLNLYVAILMGNRKLK